MLLLSSVALPVVLAGLAYARAYDRHGGPRLAAATNVFLAAMLLVLLADSIYGFLLGWEVMALASYVLVVHEHATAGGAAGWIRLPGHDAHRRGLSAGRLARAARRRRRRWDFTALRQAALEPRLRDLVFMLALIGCGTKAGVIPLHVWLPRAHPVAPSHVSALMSGVMLKIGIYGLVRIAWDLLGGGPAWWGGLVLGLGLVSAVLGVLYALMEHDLKRLLAFHSVENIGIVADRRRAPAWSWPRLDSLPRRRWRWARACSTRSTTRCSRRCCSSAPARCSRRPARVTWRSWAG